MPATPDTNMSTAPKTKPKVVVADIKPNTMIRMDPILTELKVPVIKRIIENRDAKRRVTVTIHVRTNALRPECPMIK